MSFFPVWPPSYTQRTYSDILSFDFETKQNSVLVHNKKGKLWLYDHIPFNLRAIRKIFCKHVAPSELHGVSTVFTLVLFQLEWAWCWVIGLCSVFSVEWCSVMYGDIQRCSVFSDVQCWVMFNVQWFSVFSNVRWYSEMFRVQWSSVFSDVQQCSMFSDVHWYSMFSFQSCSVMFSV